MAAAVADYTPAEPAVQKVAKGGDLLTVVLKKTPDILAELGRRRLSTGHGPVLVGFAAETERVVASATAKREAKHADLIVANDVSRADAGFEVETNEVTIVGPDGAEALPLQSKSRVAGAILDRVERLITVRLKADTTYAPVRRRILARSVRIQSGALAGPSFPHGPRSTHRTPDIRQGARRLGREPGSGLAPASGNGPNGKDPDPFSAAVSKKARQSR